MKRSFALLPLLGAFCAPLAAQTVRGRVIDTASGAPVAQAAVSAVTAEGRGAGQAHTDAEGKFALPLRAAGTVRLRVARVGFRQTVTDTLAVGVRETIDVEIGVSAAALALTPLRVTARVAPPRRRSLEMSGVYDRERTGGGHRLYREDIERQPNMTLGQVLSRVQGTTRVQRGPFEFIVFTRSMSAGTLQAAPGRYCLPALYIDGAQAGYGRSAGDINSLVTPGQIEAVELYSSAANIPVQYTGSGSACGVILIWTRAEP
jgi:hypothetical protein